MVFGLFSKEKALQRNIERALNKLAQQADRWGAMERLKEDGSEEAIYGLCRRFGVTASVGVQDEQEKAWVVEVLVELGGAAIAPVTRYVKQAQQLAYILKVVEGIMPKPAAMALVDELLADEKPGYTRDPERRLDLLRWLSEWPAATSEEVVTRLAPYLADFDQNVRYATADGLATHDVAIAGPKLVAALIRPEEESGRVKRRLAELIVEHKIPLGGDAAKVAAALTGPAAGFQVKDGLLIAR